MAHRGPTSHRLAAALLALAGLLVTIDSRYPPLFVPARVAALTVGNPARTGAERVSDRIDLAWSGLVRYPELAAENERLRAQLAVVEAAPGRQADAEAELRRVLAGTELDYVRDVPTLTARVISDRLSPSGHLLEIDKGSGSGVSEGMAVVTGRGLVGTATLVSESRSIVTPITEPGSVVGVRSPEGMGLVFGRGHGEALAITVDPELTRRVEARSRLVTSGLDRSLYPGNIPVGEFRLEADGRVEPFVDFADLSYVSVMLWRPEQ